MVSEGRAEGTAGEVAALFRVEDGAPGAGVVASDVPSRDTQFLPHVVIHVEALDTAVKAV